MSRCPDDPSGPDACNVRRQEDRGPWVLKDATEQGDGHKHVHYEHEDGLLLGEEPAK